MIVYPLEVGGRSALGVLTSGTDRTIMSPSLTSTNRPPRYAGDCSKKEACGGAGGLIPPGDPIHAVHSYPWPAQIASVVRRG